MVGNFMNSKEAADFLGITQGYVAEICDKGELVGAFKDSNSWYIPEESARVWKITHVRNRGKDIKSQAERAEKGEQ